jgi:EF hand.
MHNIISYVSVHTIDIWNVIEAFRENGLNAIELQSDVSVARFETLLSSLYHNLNKRLPVSQQVHVEVLSGLLLNWLLSAYSV